MAKRLVFTKADGLFFQPHCLNCAARYRGQLYNGQHMLRPPVGIISFSLQKIVGRLNAVLDQLDRYRNRHNYRQIRYGQLSIDNDIADNIIDNYVQLIHSVDEYSEDIQGNVVKSIVNTDGVVDKKTASLVKKFRKEVKPFRDHFSGICNALKHNQNSLNFTAIACAAGFSEGYTVAAIDGSGASAPNAGIHKTTTAFSFNVDLRRILVDTYYIGYEAGNFIEDLAAAHGGLAATAAPECQLRENGDLNKALARVSSLPRLAHPKEARNSIPIVRFDGETLEMAPVGETRIPIIGKVISGYVLRADGVTRSFLLP